MVIRRSSLLETAAGRDVFILPPTPSKGGLVMRLRVPDKSGQAKRAMTKKKDERGKILC